MALTSSTAFNCRRIFQSSLMKRSSSCAVVNSIANTKYSTQKSESSSSEFIIPPTLTHGPTPIYKIGDKEIIYHNLTFKRDEYTNVTPKILKSIGRNLHNKSGHPLSLIKRRIVDFFYKEFPSKTRSPSFAVFDKLHPIVTIEENYDSLLVPLDHSSRKKSDAYYFNSTHMLRAHMTAHQKELLKMGFNNILMVGDVYRRDTVDRSHSPIFHQVDAVRLVGLHDLIKNEEMAKELPIFESGNSERTNEKQKEHTRDAVILLENELKTTLLKLVSSIFGPEVETRWVEAYFPFTHPSWELEMKFGEEEWVEMLGCGIMEQAILNNAGANEKIGWAFGLGLERIGMKLYQIPDIRVFSSNDSGFLYQFKADDPYKKIIFKEISQYPQCTNDISFWLPEDKVFSSNDFYDLVRTVGGEKVEQVILVDEFHNVKKKRWSNTYRIVYRDMNRTLTQKEVNQLHQRIENSAARDLKVSIR